MSVGHVEISGATPAYQMEGLQAMAASGNTPEETVRNARFAEGLDNNFKRMAAQIAQDRETSHTTAVTASRSGRGSAYLS